MKRFLSLFLLCVTSGAQIGSGFFKTGGGDVIPNRGLSTWSGGGIWVYSVDVPFTGADVDNSKFVRVTRGSGWTPGFYAILQDFTLDTGVDGVQTMVRLDVAPASAGTAGGHGYIDDGSHSINNAVFGGDSITAGLGSVPYAVQVKKHFGTSWGIHNTGVSGATLSDMITQYASVIAPLYSAAWAHNYYTIFAGTNDKYSGGATAAQILSRIATLGQMGVDTGYTVFVATMLPRSGGATPGDQETVRQDVITGLATDFPTATIYAHIFKARAGVTYAKYCIRVDLIPEMGDIGDELNATYYLDQVHPAPPGDILLGNDFVDAFEMALSE